jgi:hypothetical protein
MRSLLPFAFFLVTSSAFAKIADPKPVVFKGASYQTHLTTVTATEGRKTRWKTNLPFATKPKTYVPNLEQDVQWCLADVSAVTKSTVKVKDCLGDEFLLKRSTGEILKKTYSKVRTRHFDVPAGVGTEPIPDVMISAQGGYDIDYGKPE